MGVGSRRDVWPLIGRDDECAIAVDAVRANSHVVLMGLPGVGKTRLAREVCGVAQAARRVEWILATEAAAGVPLGAAAHLIPADRLDDDRDSIFRAIGQVLARARDEGPVLVGVDDAHLLDDATSALVHQLASTDSITVIATVRSGARVSDAVTALWKDLDATVVTLQALARHEVDELLQVVLGAAVDPVALDMLWSASMGNALYLRELVGHSLDSGVLRCEHGLWRLSGAPPPSERLRSLIAARMGALTDIEQQVLATVAVGEPLPHQCIARLGIESVVDALENRGLVVADRHRLQISLAHPLIGEVVVGEMPSARLARVRRGLADVLESVAGQDPTGRFRVALLRADGGDASRPELLREAAARALSWWDGATAERLARAALAGGWELHAGHLLAEAVAEQGRTLEALEVWQRIERLDGPSSLKATIAVSHASLLHYHFDRPAAAHAVLERARGRLRDPAAIRLIDDTQRVFDATSGQLVEASDGGDRTPLASLADALNWVVRGRLFDARQIAEIALADVDRWPGDYLSIALFLRQIDALACVLAGEIDAGSAEIERQYATAVTERAEFVRAGWCVLRGWVAVLRGHADAGLDATREGLAISGSTDRGWTRPLHTYAAMSSTLVGDLSAADHHIADAEAANRSYDEVFGSDVARARSWLLAARGDTSAARLALTSAATRAADASHLIAELFALFDLARFGGESRIDRLAELAEQIDGPLARALVNQTRAAAARDGHGLDHATAAMAGLGLDLYAAEASALAAHAHRVGGHRAPAYAADARARELGERCGPVRTPSLVWHQRPGDLTLREREIAELVATGLPSRDVATRLGISTRTVDNLLGRVYVKLDVANRRELSELLGRVAAQATATAQ